MPKTIDYIVSQIKPNSTAVILVPVNTMAYVADYRRNVQPGQLYDNKNKYFILIYFSTHFPKEQGN